MRPEVPETWDGIGTGKTMRGHIFLLEKNLCKVLDPLHPVSFSPPVKDSRQIPYSLNYVLTSENLNCFTDGSRIDERTGSGFAITSGDNLIYADYWHLGNATVFQAEINAITCTALWLLDSCNIEKYYCRKIDIFSDSQSYIKALANDISKCTLVSE